MIRLALSTVVLLFLAGSVSADPLTIVNSDFQTPALSPGTLLYDPTGYPGQGWMFVDYLPPGNLIDGQYSGITSGKWGQPELGKLFFALRNSPSSGCPLASSSLLLRTCKDTRRLQLNDSGDTRICADPSFGSDHRQSPKNASARGVVSDSEVGHSRTASSSGELGDGGQPCAGINRHVVGDERALQERSSDSILTSSLAWTVARRLAKRRQRH
jgi:hypothetical protein